MKSWKLKGIGMSVMIAMLVLLTAGVSFAERGTMSPERAAQHEVTRQQHKQRVTDKQHKTAAEVLKAERMKVYRAKQAVGKSKPVKPAKK